MDITNDKRNRTSPRTNAFNEVLNLIDTNIDSLSNNVASLDSIPDAEKVLILLREAVAAKVGTQHEVEKPATTRTRPAKGQGKPSGSHYVAETQSGTLTYINSPDMALNPTNYPDFVHMWGPFNTAPGAQYAVDHQTHTNKPQLF